MSEFPPSFEKNDSDVPDNSQYVEMPDGSFAEVKPGQNPTGQNELVNIADGNQALVDQSDKSYAIVNQPEKTYDLVNQSDQSHALVDQSGKTYDIVPIGEKPVAELSEPIKLVLNVDKSSDAAIEADRMAEAKLQKELEVGGKFRKFLGSIWKGGMAKDHYIRKYRIEAEREIKESGGDISDPNAPAAIRARAKESQIWQFQSEAEGIIHTDAGEKKEVLNNNSELALGAKDLIRKYCNNEFSDDKALAEARTRMLDDYRQAHPNEDIGDGIASVDNLLEVAKTVSGLTEHGESIDNVLDKMQVIIGEARTGGRGEAAYNMLDKVIDKFARTKIGSIAMPLAIVSAVSIAMSIGMYGGKAATNNAAKAFVGFSVLSGAFAGIQENKKTKEDRYHHLRDMAEGKTFDEKNDKRRIEMDTTVYEMISAKSLKEQLYAITEEQKLADGGKDALQAAIDALAAIETRNKYSDVNKIDLISFSNKDSIVEERFQLDIARANAKAAIDKQLTPGMRAELGLGEENINQIIELQSQAALELIQDDVTEKDKLFNKIKRNRVTKAVIIAVATAVVGGVIVSEIGAAVDPTRVGLVEQIWGGKNVPLNGVEHSTLLGGILGADKLSVHTGPNADFISEKFGDQGVVSVSSESSIANNGNGTFNIIGHDGTVTAENIPINQDGSLPKGSIDQLHKLGMDVNDKSVNISEFNTSSETVDASKFVDHYSNQTTEVHRDLWYNNDTPGKFDQNELKLMWGEHGGVTDTGYQFNVSHMTEGGSFSGEQSVDWAEAAKKGDLKMAISGSIGTQNHVFMVDVDSHGNFNIPKDSPAGRFFSSHDGQAQFNGAYAEVVEVKGVDANGVTHMSPLATVVGDNHPDPLHVENTIENHVKVPVYEIVTPGYDTVVDNVVEMPPVTPVVPRQNMGTSKANYETSEPIPQSPEGGTPLFPISPETPRIATDEKIQITDGTGADKMPGNLVALPLEKRAEVISQRTVDNVDGNSGIDYPETPDKTKNKEVRLENDFVKRYESSESRKEYYDVIEKLNINKRAIASLIKKLNIAKTKGNEIEIKSIRKNLDALHNYKVALRKQIATEYAIGRVAA